MRITTGKRTLIALALFFALVGVSLADIFVSWDQPNPTENEVPPEGWQLFIDGQQAWSGAALFVNLTSLGITRGVRDVQVRGYANTVEGLVVSGFSNTLQVSVIPRESGTERASNRQGERSGSR